MTLWEASQLQALSLLSVPVLAIEVAISGFQRDVNKVSFQTDDDSDRCAIAANKITYDFHCSIIKQLWMDFAVVQQVFDNFKEK